MSHVSRTRYFAASVLAMCLMVLLTALFPAAAFAAEGDEVLGSSPQDYGLAAEELPAMDAACAVLMDEQGTVWFSRAPSEPAQIASLTKIMTALVAVDHLSSRDTITVTAEAARIGESSAGLVQGDTLTFDDALKALLCESGNDAASAIAQAAGAQLLNSEKDRSNPSSCEAAFVKAMNDKAVELKLQNSLFTNPHGLDFGEFSQGQYSCAYDVAHLLRTAMANSTIRDAIGYSEVSITVNRNGANVTLPLSNSDTMLKNYEGTCAAKTGFTRAAGPCLATAVNRQDGHEYYAVVLHSSSKPQRFVDSQALYDWIFANRDRLETAAEPEESPTIAPAEKPEPPTISYQLVSSPRSTHATINGKEDNYPVIAEVAHADWTHKTLTATVAKPGPTITTTPEEGHIEQEVTFVEIHGDVHCGDVVGHLVFRQNNNVVWESDLVATEDVNAPTWWEALGLFLERFFGSMSGAPHTAESKVVALGPLKVS